MLKSIRAYTVVLFILLIASCALLYEDLIKPYVEKVNIQSVYERLAVNAGAPMVPLVVLDSPIVNAWTDGQSITVTTGFLAIVRNNDELAMVLGHEMGHVLAGDIIHGNDGVDDRYKEALADKTGAFIMMRAGFNECRGKEIFRTFIKLFGDDAAAMGHPDYAFRLNQLDLPQCPATK